MSKKFPICLPPAKLGCPLDRFLAMSPGAKEDQLRKTGAKYRPFTRK